MTWGIQLRVDDKIVCKQKKTKQTNKRQNKSIKKPKQKQNNTKKQRQNKNTPK